MTVGTRIQIRRDTAANWTSANPVLLAGEQGLETDTRRSKIGDGSTAWTSLTYEVAALIPTAVKTGNYTAGAWDFVICDSMSGGFTVTLPTAPLDGTQVQVKDVTQGSTNTITVAAAGSDVFDKTAGAITSTLTLLGQGKVYQYKASGAIWYTVSDDIPLSQLDLRYTVPQWTAHLNFYANPVSVLNSATWAVQYVAIPGGFEAYNSTGTQNDGGVWPVDLYAGTWNVDFCWAVGTIQAIGTIDISFDGGSTYTSIGTYDAYSASAGSNRVSFTGVSVPTSGRALVRLRALTRNASAGGWYLTPVWALFTRTA